MNIAKNGENEWYKYIILVFAVFAAYNVGSIPMLAVLYSAIKKNPDLGEADLEAFSSNPDFTAFGIDANFGFFLLLLTFVCSFFMIVLLFPLLHKRPFKTLITWDDKIDWSRVFFGFFLWLAVALILELAFYFLNPSSYTFTLSIKSFLPLLVLSLLILPIQTTTEELLFRAYLMQGFSMIKNSKIFALIITSVLFGAIHSSNPEIHKFGFFTMQCYYIGAGLFLGILTLMDNRLELAIGVHAATNFTGAVFVGYEGAAIQTASLFKTSHLDPILMTVGFYVGAIIFLWIASKKYNWRSFLELNSSVSNKNIA